MFRKDIIFWFFIIVALPIVGYVAAYGLTVFLPLSDTSSYYQGIHMVLLVIFLLLVPLTMLKLLAHNAHLQDPQEKEVHFKDIPKDKDQLENAQRLDRS